MDSCLTRFVVTATGDHAASPLHRVQRLWSGYGSIVRYQLGNGRTVIVKQIKPPPNSSSPHAHQRKLRSYLIECHFYRTAALRCNAACRVPDCLAVDVADEQILLLLEDLQDIGFYPCRNRISPTQLGLALDWLAHFHAQFLHETPAGLWPNGSYWHLATRAEEWAAMPHGPLKQSAQELDRRLSAARFQTWIHGDAKPDNFNFNNNLAQAAAVDFQYVGGGCGMKDVAYLLDSALTGEQCEQELPAWLDRYFQTLQQALHLYGKAQDFDALELEWRALFPLAWADFQRFLLGWQGGYACSLHRYSQHLLDQAQSTLKTLETGPIQPSMP